MTPALAIDLGSRWVGWCIYELRPGENPTAWPVEAGTWRIENLKATKKREADPIGERWNRLRDRIKSVVFERGSPSTVLFEQTRRHEGQQAAVAYGGSLAILEGLCATAGMSPVPVQVADVKRFALGRGAGKKEEVIAAIARAFPHLGELDEHGADAVAIGGAGLTAAGWRIERTVLP